ncbi:hypothetical protein [Legionella yabuuchiae]|uniref:hypothetical protein n=1 Tax=Legionella yabuuchiae TaxID=376727 RepID=UPI0010562379|nr:hypothetical protein [Legionella yabuuchiae]
MTTSIPELVRGITRNLETRTRALSNKPFYKPELQDTLKTCFEEAFQNIPENQHHEFYKKLALEVHPDKLISSQTFFAKYLRDNDAIDLPMQVLQSTKQTEASLIQAPPIRPESMRNKLLRMSSEYKRYSAPFNLIARIISLALSSLVLLSDTIVQTALNLASLLIKAPAYFAVQIANLLTGGAINKEINDFEDSPETFELATKRYLNVQREIYGFLFVFTQDEIHLNNSETGDQELLDIILLTIIKKNKQKELPEAELKSTSENELNNDIKRYIAIPISRYLLIITEALLNSIVKPLPQGFFNVAFSLLGRGLLATLTPIVLAIVGATRMIQSVNAAINIALTSILRSAYVIGHAVLNAPLYSLDGLRALNAWFSSTAFTKAETPSNEAEPPNSSMLMLGYLKGDTNAPNTNPAAPSDTLGHTPGIGLFQKPPSRTPSSSDIPQPPTATA